MGPLVPDNVALVGETPWAHGASVGLLAGVGPLVWRNVAFLGEPPENQRRSVTWARPEFSATTGRRYLQDLFLLCSACVITTNYP